MASVSRVRLGPTACSDVRTPKLSRFGGSRYALTRLLRVFTADLRANEPMLSESWKFGQHINDLPSPDAEKYRHLYTLHMSTRKSDRKLTAFAISCFVASSNELNRRSAKVNDGFVSSASHMALPPLRPMRFPLMSS